jgi:LacI family transcriptional regulator
VRQSEDRLVGLRRAVAAGSTAATVDVVRIEKLDGRHAYAVVDDVLALSPDAVFCANDLTALGVLRGLFERERSVPGDIALVGFDDIDFAQLAAVPLTTVRQPAARMGQTAALLLLDELRNADHAHERVNFTPELVIRRSTSGV